MRRKPDALERPDVIRHQRFADLPDGQRRERRRRRPRQPVVLKIAQIRPAKTASAISAPLQLKAAVLLRVAPGEQNREDDQHRDRADVDKNLDQADEFRA